MGTSEALALKKFLVKLSSKQLEATHGMQSCHNSMPRPHKRGALDLIKYQIVKRQRLDCSLASECSTTLKQETTHPAGWVFNQSASEQACLTEHLSISQMSNTDLDSDGE
jgi:hypothetical protein